MILRAIDANGDWTYGKGANDYKTNIPALAQNIKTRLNSFLGDCFFDRGAGVDWFNLLGAKNQVALTLAIGAIISSTQNVTGILSLTMDLNAVTRGIVIQYRISTNLGVTSASTTVTI